MPHKARWKSARPNWKGKKHCYARRICAGNKLNGGWPGSKNDEAKKLPTQIARGQEPMTSRKPGSPSKEKMVYQNEYIEAECKNFLHSAPLLFTPAWQRLNGRSYSWDRNRSP